MIIEFAAHILFFFRVMIGLTFLWSLRGKFMDLARFERTVSDFQVLPIRFIRLATIAVLIGEGVVGVCMLMGGDLLGLGFALAVMMLSLFSVMLALVLRRKIAITCNCFGSSKKQVSGYELWRNAVLIFCASSGLIVNSIFGSAIDLSLTNYLIIGSMSVICFVVLLSLQDVFYLPRHQ